MTTVALVPVVGPLALLLAKATLLLLSAAGAARALRRAPAGARHLIWLGVFGALLVVPALDAWGPVRLAVLPTAVPMAIPLALPSGIAVSAPAVEPGVTPRGDAAQAAPVEAPGPRVGVRRIRPRDGQLDVPSRPAYPAVTASSGATGLLALWAVVMLAIDAALVRAWLAARGIVRRARPLDAPGLDAAGSPEWRDALYDVADRLGLADAPRLVESAEVAMPFACGLRRPTVVLPAASAAWTPERRRAVLLHELAHVRRRDLATHTLARVVCAVYWFHPLVWTAARRLRAESERACDDLALAAGTPAADYAEHLLEIVASVRRDCTPATALAMARRREFEGRLLDILDPERPRHPASQTQHVVLAGAIALVTVVVGAVMPAAAGAVNSDTGPGVGARAIDSAFGPARTNLAARTATRPGPDLRTVAGTVEDTADAAGVAPPGVPQVSADERRSDPPLRDSSRRGRTERGKGPEDGRTALLVRVLRSDTSAAVRRDAAWSLAGYPADPAAAAALVGALRGDRDGAVREMATWGLTGGDTRGSSGGADAASDATAGALSAALRSDPDAGVRATAAWALGTLGARDSRDADGALVPAPIPALVAALNDASPAVRTRAAWALGSFGEARTLRRAPDALVARLGDGDAAVRALAAWALFAVADSAAVPALDRALRTERDPAVRQADVRALGAFGARAADALRPLLDAPDPQLRAAAVRALAGGDAAAFWPWPWPRPRPYPAYHADPVQLSLIR